MLRYRVCRHYLLSQDQACTTAHLKCSMGLPYTVTAGQWYVGRVQ